MRPSSVTVSCILTRRSRVWSVCTSCYIVSAERANYKHVFYIYIYVYMYSRSGRISLIRREVLTQDGSLSFGAKFPRVTTHHTYCYTRAAAGTYTSVYLLWPDFGRNTTLEREISPRENGRILLCASVEGGRARTGAIRTVRRRSNSAK